MDIPTAAYIVTMSTSIHGLNPAYQVYKAVPTTPMIGVRVRKRMFTQSFLRSLMMKPPKGSPRATRKYALVRPA